MVGEKQADFDTLFELNPAPAMIIGLDSLTVVRANQGMEEIFGYTVAELEGSDLTNLAIEFGWEKDIEARLRRGEAIPKTEIRVVTRAERINYVIMASKPLPSERARAVMSFADISDLKQAEGRFRQTFHAAPVATCLISLDDATIVDANVKFAALIEQPREQLLNMAMVDLQLWQLLSTPVSINHLLHTTEPQLEFTFTSPSHKTYTLIASLARLESGSTPCVILMLQDVTHQRQTERDLQKALEAAMADAAWFSRAVMENLAQVRAGDVSPLERVSLTTRERSILERLAQGAGNAEIALELGISERTVRNYVSRIYSKIEVGSRAEAVVWARERGFGI